jgi:hypothetical protein
VRLIKLKLLGARGGLVMWETRIAMGWLFGCVRLVMSRWFLEGVGVLFFLLLHIVGIGWRDPTVGSEDGVLTGNMFYQQGMPS